MSTISGESNFGQPWQTWVPTYTGFSADPSTITARYILIGKLCTVHLFAAGAGTSNATTFTVTLPFAAANTSIQYHHILAVDNGVVSTGRLALAVNSNIVTLSKAITGTAWTASGTKNADFTITYEIA